VRKSTECLAQSKPPCAGEIMSQTQLMLNDLNHLERSIVEASRLQEQYEARYKEVSKIRDLLQLPILVAAGTTGLILIDGGEFAEGSTTTRAAEIGVIAATFAAGRNALTSPEMAGFYINGHSALNCAIAYGLNFNSVSSSQPYTVFANALRDQAVKMAVLNDLLEETSTGDTGKETLEAARKLGSTTLASAREIRKGALAQLVAVDRAALEFDLEASEISILVASKGQTRTAADYDTITAAFQNPANAGDTSGGEAAGVTVTPGETDLERDKLESLVDLPEALNGGGYTHAQLAQLIAAEVERLLSANTLVEGTSPDYLALLTKMKACSAIVGS
jgi:hypothetical protein